MRNVTIMLFVIFLLFRLSIWLQVVLCKKESKYLGLILPTISFIGSLPVVFSWAFIPNAGVGQWIGFVYNFLVANILTIVLLLIYFGSKSREKKNKELRKSKIQDL